MNHLDYHQGLYDACEKIVNHWQQPTSLDSAVLRLIKLDTLIQNLAQAMKGKP